MHVGITYDLRQDYLDMGYSEEETAEFDKLETVDAIDSTLRLLGHTTDRIGNIWQLTKRLAQGAHWDFVFNIAEGLRGIGREAQVPALLDAYDIPYTFSDPLVLALTLHKGMTKRVIRDLGIPTPDFAEVHTVIDVEKIHLTYPLFAKPIAEGTGKGISGASKITSQRQLKAVCAMLLESFRQPVLVERFLPGREFTVGIVGTGDQARVVGMMEVILEADAEPDVYSYDNKENYVGRVRYTTVDGEMEQQCADVALASWRGLGCRDGGRVDLRADEHGMPNFIEVNPLAGINPVHSDLPILSRMHGISYENLFRMILDSVVQRIADKKAKHVIGVAS
ncbi:ATP-grasp domain-containing protein [candidate division KSB1 bacterium]|nr:ATP-grasp domain-containing protein [candidate division KSB1 bacterium]